MTTQNLISEVQG